MIIVLRLADGSVTLREPGSFDRFSVEIRGLEGSGEVRDLVERAGLGRLAADGQHVVVDPDAVRDLAGSLVDEEWERGFSGMCAYAEAKGWVEEGGILAHIERGAA